MKRVASGYTVCNLLIMHGKLSEFLSRRKLELLMVREIMKNPFELDSRIDGSLRDCILASESNIIE